jgi:TPP-dependent indolepyruvate ferredoxin oxidoreductase alpha subunit
MIEPSDPAEAKAFTKLAFDLSETYDRPIIVRITTRIAHSQGIVDLEERQNIPVKPFVRNFQKYVMLPAHARPRHVFIEEQHKKLKEYSNTSALNRIEWNDKKRGIITNGVAYQYVKEVCPDASVLKIGMIWPMPDDMIREFAKGVEKLYVVEELDPFIEDYVKALGIPCVGKDIIPICNELNPEIVDQALNGKAPARAVPTGTSSTPSENLISTSTATSAAIPWRPFPPIRQCIVRVVWEPASACTWDSKRPMARKWRGKASRSSAIRPSSIPASRPSSIWCTTKGPGQCSSWTTGLLP